MRLLIFRLLKACVYNVHKGLFWSRVGFSRVGNELTVNTQSVPGPRVRFVKGSSSLFQGTACMKKTPHNQSQHFRPFYMINLISKIAKIPVHQTLLFLGVLTTFPSRNEAIIGCKCFRFHCIYLWIHCSLHPMAWSNCLQNFDL
jgi:hypothetical protein